MGENISIGIRFHDNDFWSTIHAFLGYIQQHFLQNREKCSQDRIALKAEIASMFNETAYEFYLMDSVLRMPESDGPSIQKYLEIEDKNVFINDEVSQHLAKYEFGDNSEFHYFRGIEGDIETV